MTPTDPSAGFAWVGARLMPWGFDACAGKPLPLNRV
jgi:hypothetical protein